MTKAARNATMVKTGAKGTKPRNNSAEAKKIQFAWYGLQGLYDEMAVELHRILDRDPRFPNDAVYAVKHRLKEPERLLAKIRDRNARLRVGTRPIDHVNFARRIDDLLGCRIVVLRLTDLKKIRRYLQSLRTEQRLTIIGKPVEKKTFLVSPGKDAMLGSRTPVDFQYSGYSSIHYIVKLGRALRVRPDLLRLRAELQLRTILEEAWGEIDHKYRYELVRSGKQVPSYVDAGFRDLALYLQAAARHADHLCELTERTIAEGVGKPQPSIGSGSRATTRRWGGGRTPAKAKGATPIVLLRDGLRRKLGFTPSEETLAHTLRRLAEYARRRGSVFGVRKLLGLITPGLLREFEATFQETTGRSAFAVGEGERNLDVVPLVDFVLASAIQPAEITDARLRATLQRGRAAGTGPAISVAKLWFGLKTTDDINTNFDIRVELLRNGSVIGAGVSRCVPSSGSPGTFIPRNLPGHVVTVPMKLSSNLVLVSGDVLAMRISARIGTKADDTLCHPPTGSHSTASGLRLFYDSTKAPSLLTLTGTPDLSETLYLRSDGSTCTNALVDSAGVTTRFLSEISPTAAAPRCKSVGTLDGRSRNPYEVFETWRLTTP